MLRFVWESVLMSGLEQFRVLQGGKERRKKLKEFLNLDKQIQSKCLSYQAIRIKIDNPKMDFILQIWRTESRRNNCMWSFESLDRSALLNCTDSHSSVSPSIMPSSISPLRKRQGRRRKP
ncbi:unnamed protein product [Paramecium octaurelia]|uniref:Uncharacterized protein n=1 Tax=Paramecium octaurelia TaxID=43137 RepID=A0A8S1VPS0_PAROT|nr:unnamed protein product [Paramecium octaurelia]